MKYALIAIASFGGMFVVIATISALIWVYHMLGAMYGWWPI